MPPSIPLTTVPARALGKRTIFIPDEGDGGARSGNAAGGLLLAHAQLVSMNNFPFLGRRLHEAEKQARPMLFDA